MPDELLRHVIGPLPYSSGWSWLAILLSVLLVVWYAGVFYLTSPGRRLRELPLVGAARENRFRTRSARAVRDIADRYRSGEIDPAQAGAGVSREVRRFLHHATGAPAEYMQLDEIADSEIRPAAGLLTQLTDVQFNTASELDVGRVAADAEELIRTWT